MPAHIDVTAPATITVLAGDNAVSLTAGAISLIDPNATGIISVTLTTADAGTTLAAGSGGGASVSSHGGTLAITGSAAQVNAALASLQISEAAGAATDTIFLTASDPAELPGHTAIAVNVLPATGPAYAAPPATLSLHPNSLSALPGLLIGDPEVTALDAAGQGAQETLAVTISAAAGVLFLPGFSALDGIVEAGLGTGTIQLSFSADRLGAVNNLLAGLQYAGPAGISGLAYSLHDVSGPLGPEYTNGNIVLNIAGAAGANGTFAAGSQTLILGAQSLGAGASLTVSGITGDLGGITGGGSLLVPADTSYSSPYDSLTLSGSSLDFGNLYATAFSETGGIAIAGGADFAGPILLGPTALVDFAGELIADGAAQVVNQLALSLTQGVLVVGDGTLLAGNFSESGRITGPGTIEVDGGGTLLLAAGSIGGGAHINVAAGGVMLLGPVTPLYGVFNATPLTIDSSVNLAFTGTPGANPITGGFADTLDQSGGVFVISGPQALSGTIANFTPGDRLIFPGLANLNLYNITRTGFNIAGQDNQGITQTYTIHASPPAGTQLYLGTDLAGDSEVSLRDTQIDVFSAGAGTFYATQGMVQPLEGLDVLPQTPTTAALTLTLSCFWGELGTGGGTFAGSNLTITAASPTALNNILAGLEYLGPGANDGLTINSNTGPLSGLDEIIPILELPVGMSNGFSGAQASGMIADFTTASLLPIITEAAPGAISISALTNFDDVLQLDYGGFYADAINIVSGATAIFGAAASVSAVNNVVLGDGFNPGSIAILASHFTIGSEGGFARSMILTDMPGGPGDAADIAGTVGISGSLYAGISSAVNLSGQLGAASATIAAAASLQADAGAIASFGRLLDAGSVYLLDQAQAAASTAEISGTLGLGGTALFTVQSDLTVDLSAQARIGADATLTAATLMQSGGGIIDFGQIELTSLVSGGAIILTGGTIIAGSASLTLGATLTGAGDLAAARLTNTGTIIATGPLTLAGGIGNPGVIDIAAQGDLDVTRTLTGNAVSFAGANAELTINDLALFTAGATNFTGHDAIDLVGVAPSLVSFAAGSISATDTAGNRIGGFALGTVAGQAPVQIISDGHGGALITVGGELPCFAAGTRLLTPNGYRAVESFSPGDPVITAAGARRPVRWIGHRTLDLRGLDKAGPVLIAAHAFGPSRPARPLRLSPLHAVFCAGVLVPALHLVNGATITHEPGRAAVTYYHIELDQHDAVLADGLACETYFDNGNRGGLYQERGVRCPAARPFAPLITGGFTLAAIRASLHEAALAAGFSLRYQPRLRVLAGDADLVVQIQPYRGRRRARFSLPAAARRLTLLANSATPADTDPHSEDRRELGVCLAPGRNARLGAGWLPRAPADAGTWMGRSSELLLKAPAAQITLNLAAVVQSWRAPETLQSWRPPVDFPRPRP